MKIQILDSKKHNRENFSCDQELLDNYLKKQVSQDVKRKLTTCYVLTDESNNVVGYYTLSSSSVSKGDLEENIAKKLPPSYSELPYALLGRLAIDKSINGQGWGEIMLMNALKACFDLSEQLGMMGVVVDPLNDAATKFYGRYGFVLLPTSGKMVISMKTIGSLFSKDYAKSEKPKLVS